MLALCGTEHQDLNRLQRVGPVKSQLPQIPSVAENWLISSGNPRSRKAQFPLDGPVHVSLWRPPVPLSGVRPLHVQSSLPMALSTVSNPHFPTPRTSQSFRLRFQTFSSASVLPSPLLQSQSPSLALEFAESLRKGFEAPRVQDSVEPLFRGYLPLLRPPAILRRDLLDPQLLHAPGLISLVSTLRQPTSQLPKNHPVAPYFEHSKSLNTSNLGRTVVDRQQKEQRIGLGRPPYDTDIGVGQRLGRLLVDRSASTWCVRFPPGSSSFRREIVP